MTYVESEPTDTENEAPLTTPSETRPQAHRVARTVAYGGLLGAVPAGVGLGIVTATGSRRGGIVASAAALAAMLVARWQLQRFFTDEPRHRVERRVGELEIRAYEPRVEAHTEIDIDDFDTALDQGFERLFHYIRGHNARGTKLAMTVPVTATRTINGFRIAFVMPPDHPLSSLPRPRDMRIDLAMVPEQRIAARCFRGRYGRELVTRQEAEMVRHVLEGGLDTTGEPVFAGYDPPTTLGLLRRNEIWMELA